MFKKSLLVLAALAVSVGTLPAATLALDGTDYNLARLINSQVELQVGDKIFSNWVYRAGTSGVAASDVLVNGIFGDHFGIAINSNWGTNFAVNQDFQFGFQVRQAEGKDLIIGASLGMLGSGFNGGEVLIIEKLCADALLLACSGGEAASLTAYHPPEGQGFDEIFFASNHTWVDVLKDVGIDGPGGISRIEQIFYQRDGGDVPGVPEPATMLLFSTALLGLGFMRRKKS